VRFLDLSCVTDDGTADSLPFKQELERAGAASIDIIRLCTTLRSGQSPTEAELREGMRVMQQAPSPKQMLARVSPSVLQAFAPIVHALADADVMVMGNGAGVSDGYLLDLARLAGVRVQLVDLGPKGITEIPVRGSVTAYIAPSHFVMKDPTTVQATAAVKAEVMRWRHELCHGQAELAEGGEEGVMAEGTLAEEKSDEESMPHEECFDSTVGALDNTVSTPGQVHVLHPAMDWDKFGPQLDSHTSLSHTNTHTSLASGSEQPLQLACPDHVSDLFNPSDPSEVVVMFVARLACQKGVGMFVRMAAMLLNQGAAAVGVT
jgi:hypothetical protein